MTLEGIQCLTLMSQSTWNTLCGNNSGEESHIWLWWTGVHILFAIKCIKYQLHIHSQCVCGVIPVNHVINLIGV